MLLLDLLESFIDRSLAPPRCARRRTSGRQPIRGLEQPLESRLLLSGTYSLLKDLQSGPTTEGSLIPDVTRVGSTTFFAAVTRETGRELWKTDGTSAGSVLVKDIWPGVNDGSYLSGSGNLINVNGTLFFIGDDGTHGPELWKSDGTESGTVMVRDINPGAGYGAQIENLINVNGTLFFTAYTSDSGTELWKSDGTESGTQRVADIAAGGGGSYPGFLTDVSGTLFFSAYSSTSGRELWKSDGTSGGTTLLKDVWSGNYDSQARYLTNVNGTLFFGAFDGTDYGLWKSDGTTAGTVLVATGNGSVGEFTAVGSTLFFTYSEAVTGEELYKSDGTFAGTVPVKDIRSGSDSSYPSRLTNVNGTLYFSADDGGSAGRELWKSDGTSGGTVQVKNIDPHLYVGSDPRYLTNVNGTLFFAAHDGSTGAELWKSDGTEGGTTLVKDVRTGYASGDPYLLSNLDGTLYFIADDGTTGAELWMSDGTSGGTTQIADVQSGTADSNVETLVDFNGSLLFFGSDENDASILYSSDGTASGTQSLMSFSSGQGTDPVVVGNEAFFAVSTFASGQELWKTDGTTAGTVMVREIVPYSAGSWPRNLTNVNGTLFFSAWENSSGYELWKSDGTEAGTVRVRDIRPGSASASPTQLTNVGGTLFFTANDGSAGNELWKSDGTEAGTELVRDISSGSSGSFPWELTNLNGTLLFSADDGSSGGELWKSDGSTAGTTQVRDVNSGTSGSYPFQLINVSGTLFFGAWDGTDYGIWKSDGTTAGTVVVATGDYSYIGDFAAVGSTLFFSYDDGTNGMELWKSDGTQAGTVLVRDIHSGSGGSDPYYLANVDGVLYFNANDYVVGERLWMSDGTAGGTVMLTPSAGQPEAVDPRAVVRSGSGLYFSAVSDELGRELFQVDPEATDPPATAPTITAPVSPVADLRPEISWTAVDGATEYEIWIKNQSTGVNPFYQATAFGTSFTPDIDLGIGRFNLWIRAKNAAGNGPWTSQYNFRVNTRHTVDDPGRYLATHTPTLTWTELPGAVKYDLWIDDKLGGVSQFIRDENVTGTSWTPVADMPLGLYHAWVRGIAADGTPGGWSVTTIFYVMPSPNVTQGINPTFDRTPTFGWDSLLGAVKYEVFIRNRIDGSTTLYQQNISTLDFTPPTSLTDGPYRVWVIGVSNVNVRSYWTNPIDIFVGGRTDVLTPVDGSTTGTTPLFSWRPVDDGAGGSVTYNLWVDRVGVQSGYINETGLSGTTWTPGSPLPVGNYRAWVQAVSSTNETIWSLVSEFTVASLMLDAPIEPHVSPRLAGLLTVRPDAAEQEVVLHPAAWSATAVDPEAAPTLRAGTRTRSDGRSPAAEPNRTTQSPHDHAGRTAPEAAAARSAAVPTREDVVSLLVHDHVEYSEILDRV